MDRMTLQETLLTRPGITGTKRHDTTHSVALFVEEMMSKDRIDDLGSGGRPALLRHRPRAIL
jgi:hypothetical protein